MNIFGHVFGFLLSPVLLLALFIVAIVAMFLPGRVIAFKTRYPMAFWIVLIFALCIQFPVLFAGCWGAGMKYAEHRPMSNVVDIAFALSPVLYFFFFFLSLNIQGRKQEKTSSAVAVLSSLGLSPFLLFLIVNFIGTLLK